MKSTRGRSEGWRHAKISGHKFEQEFATRVLDSQSDEFKVLMRFAEEIGISGKPISVDSKKGVTKVIDFTDNLKTQSKTDVSITFDSGNKINISLKKPTVVHGQAHLTTLKRFFERINFFSDEKIPDEVVFVFKAFTGETDGKKILEFAPSADLKSPKIKKHNVQAEIYQNRLYISTIQKAYQEEWESFQQWFRKNMPLITKIVLSSGYAKEESDFADAIYYGKEKQFFDLKKIEKLSVEYNVDKKDVGYYAGSTLSLPWGYLQLHRPGKKEGPYQMQFHHDYRDIVKLYTKK